MIDSYFNADFTRIRYQKNNIGKTIITSIDNFRGRVEERYRNVLNANGETVVSRASIYSRYDDDIKQGDRIYFGLFVPTGTGDVPPEVDKKTFPVIISAPQKGFNASHRETFLG
jgi:hypothetical protein